MALARNNRLSARLFHKTFAEGKTVKGGFFFLKAIPTHRDTLRYGISIPIKIVPRAVDRAGARRVIARVLQGIAMNSIRGYDVVVVITHFSGEFSDAEVGSLSRAVTRATP